MKIIKESVATVIDQHSGEILREETSTVINLPREPPYVKMYIDDVAMLHGLPRNSGNLINCLVKRLTYDGVIVISAASKKAIASELNIKAQSVSNQLGALLKREIISRVSRGEYMLNPNLFARGDWSSVRKLRSNFLEMTIRYDDNGRTLIGKSTPNNEQRRVG